MITESQIDALNVKHRKTLMIDITEISRAIHSDAPKIKMSQDNLVTFRNTFEISVVGWKTLFQNRALVNSPAARLMMMLWYNLDTDQQTEVLGNFDPVAVEALDFACKQFEQHPAVINQLKDPSARLAYWNVEDWVKYVVQLPKA